MIVFKFGGASVNDAAGIKNLAHIVVASVDDIIVIVSALGKTTNALENVVKAHCSGDGSRDKQLEEIRGYHEEIVNSLFSSNDLPGGILSSSFELLTDNLQNIESDNYDQAYDQIVSMGEIWSTMIVNQWLIRSGVKSVWIDTRKVIITDTRYRDANINWDETGSRLKKEIEDNRGKILVLQGFIGGT
ncbi:MAG: aspartate kinase, partial [Bacteroidales bacterium]|nr:aspartate kinase [Bacteroidales bacterium]